MHPYPVAQALVAEHHAQLTDAAERQRLGRLARESHRRPARTSRAVGRLQVILGAVAPGRRPCDSGPADPDRCPGAAAVADRCPEALAG